MTHHLLFISFWGPGGPSGVIIKLKKIESIVIIKIKIDADQKNVEHLIIQNKIKSSTISQNNSIVLVE